jgi:hypothetical protein
MKNVEEQLNMLQKTVMNTEDKNNVRNAVAFYVKENPLTESFVRNPERDRLHYQTSNKIINNKIKTKKRMTSIAIIIALLLGGGTSFAAENALPGESLYAIKVNVNEKVQEFVAVSNEAEAKVQARLAERRLEEAEKLAVSGKLNAETSAELRASFEEHSRKSKEHQEKLKTDAKNEDIIANINADTEISLGTHKKLLEDIEDSKPEMKKFIVKILDGVHLRLREASDNRLDIEAEAFVKMGGDVKTSAEGAMKAAQNKIDEVKKYIDTKKDILSVSMKEEFDAQIKAVELFMAEGKVKLEAQAYADAFALFKKAAREAQSAKLFVLQGGGFKIDFKHNDATSTVDVNRENSEDNSDQEQGDANVELRNKTELELNIEEKESSGNSEQGSVSGSGSTKIEIKL